jgi:hypothetical protein
MADISDVIGAIVTLVAAAAYPSGTGSPSVIGADVRVYEGWPLPQQLDTDLAAGKAHVSLWALPDDQVTSRYLNDGETTVSISTAKLQMTVSGQTITLAGTIPGADDPHTLVLLVNGKPYAYAVLTTDSLATAMASLADLVAVDVPGASSSGAVITLPTTGRVGAARVAVTGTYSRVLRTQTRSVQITVWASSPALRSTLASAIDVALADTRFLVLSDQKARLIYRRTIVVDKGQKEQAYRRDLIYSVEYSTTVVKKTTTVAVQTINTSVQGQNTALAAVAINTTNL